MAAIDFVNVLNLQFFLPAPVAQVVECPLRGTGGHGFDPGPRHTKLFKNSTSCSSLGTQTYGIELGLVDPVSGYCDWVWYHVKCLEHDTSVRQHFKSEHWAPRPVVTRHRRDMTENLLKATLNPKQQQQKIFLQDPPVFYQKKKS